VGELLVAIAFVQVLTRFLNSATSGEHGSSPANKGKSKALNKDVSMEVDDDDDNDDEEEDEEEEKSDEGEESEAVGHFRVLKFQLSDFPLPPTFFFRKMDMKKLILLPLLGAEPAVFVLITPLRKLSRRQDCKKVVRTRIRRRTLT